MIHGVKARAGRGAKLVKITFAVDRQTWAGMARAAQEGMFFDRLDYITGTLNGAFLTCFPPEPDTGKPSGNPDDIPF